MSIARSSIGVCARTPLPNGLWLFHCLLCYPRHRRSHHHSPWSFESEASFERASMRAKAHGERHDVTTCRYGTTVSALHAVKPGPKPRWRELEAIIGRSFLFAAIETCKSPPRPGRPPVDTKTRPCCPRWTRLTPPLISVTSTHLITDKLPVPLPAQKSPAPFPEGAVPLAHRLLGTLGREQYPLAIPGLATAIGRFI